MVNLLKKYNLHKNSKKREFSGKYSSEKQAFYYELAEKEGINIDDRNLMKNFILEKNKEIFGIIEKTGGKKVEGYYFNAVSEIRQKYGLTKYYNLDFLQKIVNFESNKKAFDELGIVYEDLLKLPKNNILQNEDIKKIKVPRIEDLIESQTDKDFGFVIEWIANGIDVSTPGESIGRFGEGFLQSLEKIDIPGSKIIVSTKSEDSEGYDLHIKKQNGELKFGSLVNDKIESGTSVKIEKKFSEQQIKQIEEIIINKLKTNTKANIILNGKKFNNLTAYKYINGEELNLSGIPTVELKLNENSFEVIDNGKGMSEEVIVKKLLRPNSTGNTRKELSDEEVREATKKETKFFYKKKDSYDEKTNVSLNISGVNIESFEVDTIGNIGDFTFEFPSSSSLKDSRNEIDLSKEVASSMGVSLEKIESKSESLEEKLSLLEIISGIYEKLKDRPTNIVDEEFVLSSVMKTNFFSIRENLEKEGISVLPANKALVDTIGKADDVFYISEEFVDFDINNIKAKKEIERVKSVSIKGSLIGEKYKFFEMNFAESSQYDYLVFEGNVFINSKLFTGKSIEEQDKIIHILNTSINLNTSYETDSDRNDYGRILTSKEEFIVKSEKKEKTLIDTNQSVKKKDEPESVLDDEDHEKLQQIKNEILLELDELRKKYGNKLEKFGIFSEFNEDILFLGSEYFILWGDSESKKELEAKNIDYEKIRKSNLFAIKINYLLGLNVYYEITGMDNLTKNSKLFVLINNILNNKSEKITKPYIKFLQKKIGIIGVGAMSMKDLAGISKEIETLNKIIETDPNTAIELMQRFEDNSVVNIFKDFTEIEEKNKILGENKEEDDTYILALDESFTFSDYLTLSNELDRIGVCLHSFGKEVEFISGIKLSFAEESSNYIKSNLDSIKGSYISFKKDFILTYEKGYPKRNNNGFDFNQNLTGTVYNKYTIPYFDPELLYIYFKLEDKINKNNKSKEKGEQSDKITNSPTFLNSEHSHIFENSNSINKESFKKIVDKYLLNYGESKMFIMADIHQNFIDYNIDEKSYILFKNKFIEIYEGFKEQNIYVDEILLRQGIREYIGREPLMLQKIENILIHFNPDQFYAYFKSETDYLNLVQVDNVNDGLEKSYEERLTKEFVSNEFNNYSEFIDDFLKGSKNYMYNLNILDDKYSDIYDDDSELDNQATKETEELIDKSFSTIFKKYGISGEGLYPMLFYFLDCDNKISNYKDLHNCYVFVSDIVSQEDYYAFREDYIKYILKLEKLKEYVDGFSEIIKGKEIDYKKINEEYYKLINEKYGINEGQSDSFEKFLYANYVLTKNFLDKEIEKEVESEEGFEYRIDDTDSIFDEKFSFLLDIIKGLDNNFNYDENANEGAVKIFMGSGRQEIWSNTWDRYLNFIEKFNDIFEDKLLPGNFRKLDWFEKEGGKKLQKQLFEELIKNPDYRDLFIKEKKRVPKKQKIDIFQELSKKYPQDLITFLQFLKSGGEFLKNSELSVEEFSPSMEILHSDLIGLTLHEEDKIVENNSLDFLEELKNKHLDAGFNYKDNRDIIAGVNIAQDSVGMLFLREGTQNSIDAIKRHNEKNPDDLVEEKVKINFYSEQNHFVSSFTDPVGMELKDVIVKLLVPYNSGKDALDDGVGQFGKGFFTFAPDTKQIRIKTSLGDGKVNYLELNPIKINGVVSDFNIKISEKKEEFRGTIIERIDEKKGISGNLRAMIGVNLAKKYIGNIRGVDIEYNGTTLNQQKDIESLSISEDIKGKNKNGNIVNLGSLELLKNNDNISRFTKNDLWISEIKDDLLSDLPDWMKDFFMESNLTVNIPDSIPLLGSRNSLKNREYYIDLLKPYFYKQVVDYTLKSYVSRDFKIPMMPEDYLMLVKYDFGHSSKILNLADRFNSSNEIDFSSNEIEFLKDKEQMRELLVLCNFNLDGELTSLYDIKQQLHRDELEKSKVYQSLGSGFTSKISQAIKLKEDLNKNDNKFNLNFDEIENIVGIEKKEMKEFVTFIYRDFDSLIKKHFGGHFEISFYSGSSGVANSFSNHGNGMAFNINSSIFKNLVSDYRSPEIYEKVIDITTHEMTHNLEGDKWGTHETDEEHPKSFMKIHRGLLRDFVRSI